MSTKYFPIIKTTIAEIRAIRNLQKSDLQNMIPILELTKSRKSKNNQESCVYRKIDEVCELLGSKEFILDITGIESLVNEQIESFQDDSNGFENWCNFINKIKNDGVNVVPILLAYPDSSLKNLSLEASQLCRDDSKIAVRVPVCEADLEDLFDVLKTFISNHESSIEFLIFDAGYIDVLDDNNKKVVDVINGFLGCLSKKFTGSCIFASSFFPASPLDKITGDKMNNSFSLGSSKFYHQIKALLGSKVSIQYGDYACIHPYRGDGKAYNWIPRIDYPILDKVFFSRTKREDGGYVSCAKTITALSEFSKDNLICWGMSEIKLASGRSPGGLSPSYWISVRSNIHMTRMSSIYS